MAAVLVEVLFAALCRSFASAARVPQVVKTLPAMATKGTCQRAGLRGRSPQAAVVCLPSRHRMAMSR